MKERGFRFKRFKMYHGGCSLPIGTDAVILGAYAGRNVEANTILDIGTGSGVIALMLAQRFQNATVHGVEIDPDACEQARQNFKLSPFSKRLQVFRADISTFDSPLSYDLMVCNPPYFYDSLKPENAVKKQSKHAENKVLDSILRFAIEKLDQNGILQIIYPYDTAESLVFQASGIGLYAISRLNILPSPGKKPVRAILDFSIEPSPQLSEYSLIVESGQRHAYHPGYLELCKDFYLKFPD